MPALEDVLGAVDAWFSERIAKGPIAHHVPAMHQARLAVGDETGLKARLAAMLAQPAEPEPEGDAVEEPGVAAESEAETSDA